MSRTGRIAAIAFGLGLAMIVGAAYLFGLPSALGLSAANPASAESEAGAHSPGPMIVLKERVVNLADPGGRKYLKFAASIEFATGGAELRRAGAEERREKQAEFEKSLAPQVPLIEDAIITVLTARTTADVSTPEGKVRLKNDLKERLNQVLGKDQVANIYFTQFVMQ